MIQASERNSSGSRVNGVRLSVVRSNQEVNTEMTSEHEIDGAAPEAAVTVQVKKKDFVDRVSARSGTKKPVARNLTDVVLAVLGEALAEGETLILPPLGRVSLVRKTGKAGSEVMHLKLKRMTVGEGAKKGEENAEDPLAEPQE